MQNLSTRAKVWVSFCVSLHQGSEQLLESGLFPEDRERSCENEVKRAFALPGALAFIACSYKEIVHSSVDAVGKRPGNTEAWKTAQKPYPRDEPMQRTNLAPAGGSRAAT